MIQMDETKKIEMYIKELEHKYKTTDRSTGLDYFSLLR